MNKWALTLLPLLVLSSTVRTSIAVTFINNQQEIAAYQCEQKDVPGNCCQGTCVLTKAIKKATTNSESPMERSESKHVASSVLAVEAYTDEKKMGWLKRLLKSLFPNLEPQLA